MNHFALDSGGTRTSGDRIYSFDLIWFHPNEFQLAANEIYATLSDSQQDKRLFPAM